MKGFLIRMFYKLPLPLKFKRRILRLRRQIIGYEAIKDNEVKIEADLETSHNYIDQILHIPSVSVESESYVPLSNRKFQRENDDIKLFAFYLTQYHPTKENDEWWGKGTTEWNNVARAVPQFLGQSQPRLPDELGYYDLRIKDVMRRQIELAKQYGVYGFCFYHYWFGEGKRILEKPLNMFLEDKTLDIPFFYCWANHNWYKKFQGTSDEVLIKMPDDKSIYMQYVKAISADMKDERYYKINGKPVLMVYRPSDIPNVHEVLKAWREDTEDEGFTGLYVIAVHEIGERMDYRKKGFDASSEFHPTTISNLLSKVPADAKLINSAFSGSIYDYTKIVSSQLYNSYSAPKLYKSAMTFWDNTARRNSRALVFTNESVSAYKKWIYDLIDYNRANSNLDDNLAFINAWNEWGEGAYLEPDKQYGYALLEATREAIEEKRRNK